MLKKSEIVFFLFLLLILYSCRESANNAKNSIKKKNQQDSCCKAAEENDTSEIVLKSVIKCPECGFSKSEKMPSDVCLIKYNCENCGTEMRPKEEDCCVFCTYGDHKCPSMQ